MQNHIALTPITPEALRITCDYKRDNAGNGCLSAEFVCRPHMTFGYASTDSPPLLQPIVLLFVSTASFMGLTLA